MSKYIDADKLIAEIERRKKQDITFRERCILIDIETAVDSLQQEQPSLPSNLDEAAKEYMRNYIPFDQCDSRDIIRTFKAGAKWKARQEIIKSKHYEQ